MDFISTYAIYQFITIGFCGCLIFGGFLASNITFIGPLFWYEKVVMPLFILMIFGLIKFAQNPKIILGSGLIFLVAGICVIRNQMLAISAILMVITLFASVAFRKERIGLISASICVLLGIGLALIMNIPVFNKTKAQFGVPVLSTQAGYELMQGHNPLARGSWRGTWMNEDDDYYLLSRSVIKNLDSLNELEESEARKNFAIQWAISNPVQELILCLRKVAIFLMPINFQSGICWFNVLIHLFFVIGALGWVFLGGWTLDRIFVAMSILSIVVLCLVFFTDMRWRYYAEPFMVLVAVCGTLELTHRLKWRINP